MANKFVSWLEHAGRDIEKVAIFAVKDVLPVSAKLLQVTAPLVSLAFPVEGATMARFAGYIVAAEAKFPTPGSGESKLQYVLQLVEGELLPLAQQAGLTGQDVTDEITKYLNALVVLFSGPTITKAAVAQAPALTVADV